MSAKLRFRLLAVATFLAAAVHLLSLTSGDFLRLHYEEGDIAANSILVLKAKELTLFHGHYSRFGFFHPGPAFLYVQAAGEAVFHDWLGLTPPAGGQAVAVMLLNAGWLALLAFLFARLSGSATYGFLAVAAFSTASLLMVPRVFTDLWPPWMFYLPFAAFLAALVTTIRGDARGLPPLALTAGFLVNGYVSFVPIIAILLVAGIVANAALLKRTSWLRRETLRRERKAVLWAVGIGAALLSPILVETVLNWPGQIPRYARVAGMTETHAAGDGARFLLDLMGPFQVAAVPTFALALVLAASCERDARRSALLMLAVLAGATAVTFLHVVAWVDNLVHGFTTLFAVAMPALWFAVAVASLGTILRPGPRAAFTVLLGVLLVWAVNTEGPRMRLRDRNTPVIPAIQEAVAGLGPGLVLEIEPAEWETVWPFIAGVEIRALREGARPYCIAEQWHILFGEQARCTADQIRTGRRIKVRLDRRGAPGPEPLLRAGGLAFDPARQGG